MCTGFGRLSDALWCGSGDVPGVAVVAESEVHKPPQVDRRRSQTEAEFVRFHTTESDSSMIVRDQMSDSSFDVWAVLFVVSNELVVVIPACPVRGEELVVFGHVELLAASGCGAPIPDWAAPARHTKGDAAVDADVFGDTVRARHGPGVVVEHEIVSVELIVAEPGVLRHRPRLDHRPMTRCVEFGESVARSVGRISQDLQPRWLLGEEADAGCAIGSIRWGEVARGDDPGVGLDSDVSFVAIAIDRP